MSREQWSEMVTDLCVLHGRRHRAHHRLRRVEAEDDPAAVEAAKQAAKRACEQEEMAFATIYERFGPQTYSDLSNNVSLLFTQADRRYADLGLSEEEIGRRLGSLHWPSPGLGAVAPWLIAALCSLLSLLTGALALVERGGAPTMEGMVLRTIATVSELIS